MRTRCTQKSQGYGQYKMKRFLRTAVILLCVAGLASSCSKDKDEDKKDHQLVGTTWKSGQDGDDWSGTIHFTNQSSATMTESEASGTRTYTSTYTFNNPNIVINLPPDRIFTGIVTGNTMTLKDQDDIFNATFTKQQ